jgi:polysaccharide export outer membrane protein
VVPSEAYSFLLSEYLIEPPDVLRITVISDPTISPVLSGDFPVTPDGKVNLGAFGQVTITGQSVADARNVIAAAVRPSHPSPTVIVEIVDYNSKAYYLVHDIDGADNVLRLPFTGNDDVLNALSQLDAKVDLSQRNIWISRPSPPPGRPEILKIDLDVIAAGANPTVNYQMLPGDRLFVSSKIIPTLR